MVDLREKVAEDRTFLKKLELAIPGFRGYRKREDRRAADSLLRKQLADKLRECTKIAEEIRETLASQMEIELIREAGNLVNKLDALESKVRHAEQGYAGISPDIRVLEEEIERLYEFDYSLITGVEKLKNLLNSAKESLVLGDVSSYKSQMNAINSEIKEFLSKFNKRIEIITETGVFS
jgi:flagellar motility protein MotE (MotC chaperone)